MKKYIAYYRKSTDVEDKQVLSLGDQARVVREFSKSKDLYVPRKLEFEESYSAKAPGRPVFDKVVSLLRQKKAQGIISYKADRLTRNYTDLGTLVQLLENEIEIWTTGFGQYKNDANGMMFLGINTVMAKRKIDDLSEDTKRGMEGRTKNGWWAGQARLGYLNVDKYGRIVPKQYTAEKQKLLDRLKRSLYPIEKDPLVAPFIKKAYELYYYQDYSLKTLSAMLYKEGLRSRCGNKVVKTSLSQMLKNPFYYGVSLWKKEIRDDAKHQPIISKELYDLVQEKLSGKSPFQPQPQKLDFLYRGLLFCGECGCSITAERHTKKMKNGNVHRYIYYRCTKTKGNCNQSYISEDKLELELGKIFKNFILSKKRANAIQCKLRELFQDDLRYQDTQEKTLKDRLEALKEEKKKIYRKMATDKLPDQDTYLEVNNDIQNEIVNLQEKLSNIGRHSKEWLEHSSNLIYLAKNADKLFLEGTKEEKHTLINCAASNLFLKDRKVSFSLKKPFAILAESQKSTTLLPRWDSNNIL